MALSDVIGRPLVNPLEGLEGGIATGFEIAQRREQLALQQQELGLKKQQIDNDFLEKGMAAIGNIAKSKGSGKKFYANLAVEYFKRGGITNLNTDTLLQDPEMPDNLAAFAASLDRMFPGTSIENLNQKRAAWTQVGRVDPEGVKPYFEGIANQEKALLAQQTFGSQSAELAKRELTKKAVSTDYPPWMKQQMMTNPVEAMGFVQQHDQFIKMESQLREDLKRSDLIDPKKRADLQNRINQAKAAMNSPDTYQQGAMMLQDASVEASGLVAESAKAKKVSKAKTEKGKPLSDKAIESLTTFQEIPRLINDVKSVIKANPGYFGPMVGRGLRLGEQLGFQTTTGSTIDGLLTDVKQTVGKLKEGGVLRLEDEKKYERMLPSIKDKPEVALGKADQILRDMNSKVKTFIETNRKAGRDVSQFEGLIQQLVVPPLPPTVLPKEQTKQQPGKQQFSLSRYKAANPNLTKDQYDLAKKQATSAGYEVID